jgi:hypothetical protein
MVYEFEKYFGTNTNLIPHFRIDLYTKTKLVYLKGDTRPTLVPTDGALLAVFMSLVNWYRWNDLFFIEKKFHLPEIRLKV